MTVRESLSFYLDLFAGLIAGFVLLGAWLAILGVSFTFLGYFGAVPGVLVLVPIITEADRLAPLWASFKAWVAGLFAPRPAAPVLLALPAPGRSFVVVFATPTGVELGGAASGVHRWVHA